MSKKIIEGEKTKALILKVARKLFSKGHENVSASDIAEAAHVTRGALYHHFEDKKEIFREVVLQVAAEIVEKINESASAHATDPKSAVVEGCIEFLKVANNPEFRQIFLLDAPTVLGWPEWRRIDEKFGLGSLKEGLGACSNEGSLDQRDIDTDSLLISGALNEMVFFLAETHSNKINSRIRAKVEQLVSAFVVLK
jgi:AcrR family transcriptional regulator